MACAIIDGVGGEMGQTGDNFLASQSTFTPPAHVLATLLLQMQLHDKSAFVADSASTVHVTGSDRQVYNRRVLSPREASLVVGDVRMMPVECYGDLDVVFFSERRPPRPCEGFGHRRGAEPEVSEV